jgi:hypothetical protein
MSVLMQMFWENINPEQYEKLRSNVNWEGNTPKGAIFHVSAFDERGIHVIDLWDSTEELNSFIDRRLMPEVRKMGITDMPQVDVYNSYSTSVPGYHKVFGDVKQSV